MRVHRRSKLNRAAAIAISIALPLTGCTKWGGPQDPREVLADEGRIHRVKILLRDGADMVLDRPILVGDSIRGTTNDLDLAARYEAPGTCHSRRSLCAFVTIPVADVSWVELETFDGKKTAGVVGLIGAAAFTIMLCAEFSC